MERDDLILDETYARSANHSEEHGKAIRKVVLKVTIIMTLITVFEVIVGVMFPKNEVSEGAWLGIKIGYIVLTLIKAGYIVLKFMHLGDEDKSFKWIILTPYFLFIAYLIWIIIEESTYITDMYHTFFKM